MKVDNKLILEYSKNLNVLYVEDNKELRESTVKIFKNYFSSVDTAENGAEGLEKYNEYFKKNEECYDLILSDINMPIMNGIEFANMVLSEHYGQSIVFITAHNEVEYLQKSIDLGINGFITKPIAMEQLKKVLYKVTQAIYDRKTVSLHYEIIKKLNLELESKNKELENSLRISNTTTKKEQATSVEIENLLDEVESVSNQINSFVTNDLAECKKILIDINSNITSITKSYGNDMKIYSEKISHGFSEYASILSAYSIFIDLSDLMKKFSVLLKDSPFPTDESKTEDAFTYLESFMFVLGKWSDGLGSNLDDKANFLDTSLINDMKSIIKMWTAK